SQLSAIVAHLRADGRALFDAAYRYLHRVRRVDRHRAGQPAGGAANARVVGAPALREDVRAGARERPRWERREEAHLLLGATGRRPLGEREARRPRTRGPTRPPVPDRTEAGVLQAAGAH